MTNNQQRILIFLSERIDARSREIIDALSIGHSTFLAAMTDLYDDDLVRRTKVGSKHVCRYFLTPDGLVVASRLPRIQTSQIPVPHMLINKLEGHYVPPSWGYIRGDNNTKYQSRGIA